LLCNLLSAGDDSPLARHLRAAGITARQAGWSDYYGTRLPVEITVPLEPGDQVDAARRAVRAALRELASAGAPADRVAGVLKNEELAIESSREDLSASWIESLCTHVLHGQDPQAFIDWNPVVKRMRQRLAREPRFIQDLAQRLLDTPHFDVLAVPEAAPVAAAPTPTEPVDTSAPATAAANRFTELPISDLAAQALPRPVRQASVSGVDVAVFDNQDNRIAVALLESRSTIPLPPALERLMPIYMELLTRAGFGNESAATATAADAALATIDFYVEPARPAEPSSPWFVALLSQTLEPDLPALLERLQGRLLDLRFDEPELLSQVVDELWRQGERAAQDDPACVSDALAHRDFTATGRLDWLRSSPEYTAELKRLAQDLDDKATRDATVAMLGQQLTALHRVLLSGPRYLQVATRPALVDTTFAALQAAVRPNPWQPVAASTKPPSPATPSAPPPRPGSAAERLAWPFTDVEPGDGVAYITAVAKAPHGTHADAAPLAVAMRLLSDKIVFPECRAWGAYGGNADYDPRAALITLRSWDDPSRENLPDLVDHVQEKLADITPTDVAEAVRSLIIERSAPKTRSWLASVAMLRGCREPDTLAPTDVEMIERLRHVDVDAVKRAIATYLTPESFRCAVIAAGGG
jgi:Zn-dependent M16 (insulinase) family peptidase